MNFELPPWYKLTPAPVLAARADNTAAMCAAHGLDGALFSFATDVYYLSGTMQQGVVFVGADGRVRPMIRRHAGRAAAESPLAVEPISGLTQAAGELGAALPALGRLGMTLDVLSAADYLGWKKRLAGVEIVDITKPWLDIKAVKDAWEIDRLRAAGRLAAEVYAYAQQALKPGMSELKLAGLMQAFAMSRGNIDVLRSRAAYLDVYAWHVVAGAEATTPSAIDAPFSGWGPSPAFPAGASPRTIMPGEPLIVDFGICYDGYLADQTRTFCLGEPSRAVRAAHDCLAAVEAAMLEAMRPGAVSGEVFALARRVAEDMGMGEVFLGRPGHRIRFAGHGVGLELGSPPYILEGSQAVLRAGEAYALELKIVLDEGPVGLENSVVVRGDGPPELLTPIPARIMEAVS